MIRRAPTPREAARPLPRSAAPRGRKKRSERAALAENAAAWAADAAEKALLFPDTYTNYSNTTPGKAAVLTLEAAGVHVEIPDGRMIQAAIPPGRFGLGRRLQLLP